MVSMQVGAAGRQGVHESSVGPLVGRTLDIHAHTHIRYILSLGWGNHSASVMSA